MQGAVTTSLETLQMLAAGSTNLAKLKKLSGSVGDSNDPSSVSTAASQVSMKLYFLFVI